MSNSPRSGSDRKKTPHDGIAQAVPRRSSSKLLELVVPKKKNKRIVGHLNKEGDENRYFFVKHLVQALSNSKPEKHEKILRLSPKGIQFIDLKNEKPDYEETMKEFKKSRVYGWRRVRKFDFYAPFSEFRFEYNDETVKDDKDPNKFPLFRFRTAEWNDMDKTIKAIMAKLASQPGSPRSQSSPRGGSDDSVKRSGSKSPKSKQNDKKDDSVKRSGSKSKQEDKKEDDSVKRSGSKSPNSKLNISITDGKKKNKDEDSDRSGDSDQVSKNKKKSSPKVKDESDEDSEDKVVAKKKTNDSEDSSDSDTYEKEKRKKQNESSDSDSGDSVDKAAKKKKNVSDDSDSDSEENGKNKKVVSTDTDSDESDKPKKKQTKKKDESSEESS